MSLRDIVNLGKVLRFKSNDAKTNVDESNTRLKWIVPKNNSVVLSKLHYYLLHTQLEILIYQHHRHCVEFTIT